MRNVDGEVGVKPGLPGEILCSRLLRRIQRISELFHRGLIQVPERRCSSPLWFIPAGNALVSVPRLLFLSSSIPPGSNLLGICSDLGRGG